MTWSWVKAMTLGVAVLAACSDDPTGAGKPSDPPLAAAMRDGEPVDVPELRFTPPPRPRKWDRDDSALVAALEAEDGHATIVFKEPGSEHSLQSGRRPAVGHPSIRGALAMLRGRGVEILQFFSPIGAAYVRIDPALAPQIRGHPLVDFLEPRQWQRIDGVRMPRIARLATTTSQVLPWGLQLVRAPEAWSFGLGVNAKVWIIDTPYDRGHEDLPLIPLDNCAGCFGGGCNGSGDYPHGTHVLGILTARDNDRGIVGVAPGVLPDNVGVYGACTTATGECSTCEITAGIMHAVARGADVINMSLSGTYDAAQAVAVAGAWQYGAVLVAAAGNSRNNEIRYPAGYEHVIGVSGVRPDGSFARSSPCLFQYGGAVWSNWGPHVDLAAPFWALSTVPGGYQDEHDFWCGTSFATPHVSAAAALLRSRYPSWKNSDIVGRLLATAQGSGTRNDSMGFGVVDAAAAQGYAPPPPPPFLASVTGPTSVRPGSSCLFSAGSANGVDPYSYSWTADTLAVGDNSATYRHNAGASSFLLMISVTDGQGRVAWNSVSVMVSSDAPECIDQ